jgi:acetoacetate decarboxylase
MIKVKEKTYPHCGMPIHNPLYTKGRIHFRAEVFKGEFIVEKLDRIANIVPEPLIYHDNKIFVVLMMVKGLIEGFPRDYSLWNEIAVQIPVIHNGEPGLYVCENYTDDIGGIISGREIYGYPKVPGDISLKKK